MDILRDDYIRQLESKSWNGKVKIITGIRRCGKSYLLSHLYKQHLIKKGVKRAWTDNDGVTYIGIIPFLLNTEKAVILA